MATHQRVWVKVGEGEEPIIVRLPGDSCACEVREKELEKERLARVRLSEVSGYYMINDDRVPVDKGVPVVELLRLCGSDEDHPLILAFPEEDEGMSLVIAQQNSK